MISNGLSPPRIQGQVPPSSSSTQLSAEEASYDLARGVSWRLGGWGFKSANFWWIAQESLSSCFFCFSPKLFIVFLDFPIISKCPKATKMDQEPIGPLLKRSPLASDPTRWGRVRSLVWKMSRGMANTEPLGIPMPQAKGVGWVWWFFGCFLRDFARAFKMVALGISDMILLWSFS